MRYFQIFLATTPFLCFADTYEDYINNQLEQINEDLADITEMSVYDNPSLYWFTLGQKFQALMDLSFYRITKH